MVHDLPGSLGASIMKFDRIPPGFGGNLDYFQCAIFNNSGNVQFGAVASRFASDDTALSALKEEETPYNVGFVFTSEDERHCIVDGVLEGSDFVHCEAFNGLEGIIIFTSYTSSATTFNKPVGDICVEEICVWRNAKTAAELAPLNNFSVPPTSIDIANIILHLPCVDAASIGDAFEYVSNPGIPTPVAMTVTEGDGTFADEEDCFPVSDCPPCEADPEPCGETVEPACNAEWPFALLQPRSVGIHLVPGNIGGGPAMAGGNEQVAATANALWRFTYSDIPIHDPDQILAIRAMEVLLEGRAGVICLHAYDGKRAPWLTVGSPIIASADSAIAVGATSGSIKMTSGGVPLPGMFFSWEDTASGSIAGPWLYCLETVGAPSGSPPVYPVTFQPPLRTAIPDDDPLEFDRPMCRARLADDRGLSMELNLLEHASHTVEFEEAI